MQPLLNTVSMTSYPPSQTLHPLSLLAQISSRQVTGCLQVSTPTMTWSLYLERGRLNFATTSIQAFDRLDAHLRRLSSQVPTLVSAVRVQVRLLFEQSRTTVEPDIPDYRAICWLVQQQHLHPNQAATLVEAISKDVLESFLTLKQGSYGIVETDFLATEPKFSQLDLRPAVEECYGRLKQRRNGSSFSRSQPQPNYQSPSSLGNNSSVTSQKAEEGNHRSSPQAQPKQDTYKIACIDDSPTVLRAIKDFLDDKSFSVITISDPVKALMQVVRNKPDLILLDVTMPNLDGYELCSLLRRHPEFKQTPIIMVTSNTGFIDRAKAKLVRASGYMTKPFNQSDLLKIIFKHLN